MTQELVQESKEANSFASPLAQTVYEQKYAWRDEAGNVVENWSDTAYRVTRNVLGALGLDFGEPMFMKVLKFIQERKFIPAGRYLYSAGRDFHQCNNCFLLRAEDSREGWADLVHKATMTLQTGGGVGVDYSDIRPAGAPIRRTGGIASGPIALMHMVNECGRYIQQGGSRRSAIIALLRWDHPDIEDFIHLKDWSDELVALKDQDLTHPLPMELTNISVILDDNFFEAMEDPNHSMHLRATQIYSETVRSMVSTGEPGFSIDTAENAGETLRNPCGEITSADDSDVCCLGSINLAQIQDRDEMIEAVEVGTLFLLAGTVYSDIPYDKVSDIREQNRRLGLGLMGVHEWLLQRGKPYQPDDELGDWLEVLQASDDFARIYADQYGLSRPIKTRAAAPTGSISILGETTSGIEPLFCVAYKRRYMKDNRWHYQYVMDPTAKRLIEEDGIDPDTIEDAYMLSYNVERRFQMQAWIQEYIDHAVSSTVNLPYPIEDEKEIKSFSDMLYEYLPKLRGITCFPDGARSGQPLAVASYEEAKNNQGVVYEEIENSCKSGSCSV